MVIFNAANELALSGKTLSESEMNEYTTLTGRTRSSDWSTKIPVPSAPSHPA
jgi:hypothetical protein